MEQHWTSWLINKLLAPLVTPLLVRLGYPPQNPAYPIPNYVACELLVALLLIIGSLILRSRLSVEDPGKPQHIMEVIVKFTQDMTDELIGHDGRRYVGMIATLGLFILISNLLGLIPTLETPTAHIQVTLGCAVAAFLYYNFHGVRQHGVLGYLKHLSGPMAALAIMMFPIEIVSNLGRLLSLSVRLYANMLVGDLLEQVFGGVIPSLVPSVFGGLISIVVPPIFDALHIFVSLLQAYIFMLLPAIYISMAVAEEH